MPFTCIGTLVVTSPVPGCSYFCQGFLSWRGKSPARSVPAGPASSSLPSEAVWQPPRYVLMLAWPALGLAFLGLARASTEMSAQNIWICVLLQGTCCPPPPVLPQVLCSKFFLWDATNSSFQNCGEGREGEAVPLSQAAAGGRRLRRQLWRGVTSSERVAVGRVSIPVPYCLSGCASAEQSPAKPSPFSTRRPGLTWLFPSQLCKMARGGNGRAWTALAPRGWAPVCSGVWEEAALFSLI